MMQYIKKNILPVVLLLLLCYPVIFMKLGSFSMRIWDESFFAVNTYEMMERNEFFIPYRNGVVDTYNFKPPLINWAQMISVSLFGYNEPAIRLPSAIAATLIIIALFFFIRKHFNSLFAWIAALVLLTTHGFITFHSARTGDADTVFTMFVTFANLLLIDSILKQRIKNTGILLFFGLLSLAFWTKSIAVFLFFPGYLLIGILYWKKLFSGIFRNGSFRIGLLMFTTVIGGLLIIREARFPGYFGYIINHEAGRLTVGLEGHKQSFDFYIWNLFSDSYYYWFMLFVLSLVLPFINNIELKIKRLLFTIFLLFAGYLSVISLSVTKVFWYLLPAFPLLAIGTASLINYIVLRNTSKKIIYILAVAIVFIIPYTKMFNYSQANSYTVFENKNEAIEKYLHKALKTGKNIDDYYVYHRGENCALKFYRYRMKELGQELHLVNIPVFEPGCFVIASDDSLKQEITEKYNTTEKDHCDFVTVYQINNYVDN
ncbi:MAG: glycosyltransferase family 39 protein [Bacteroidetes bacterium]|nr:glycosyltransferase family 39 protein [Bacteroidota bacterium]